MSKQYNVAIIGLGFGAEFIPIYQRHPQANMYAICQRTEESLNEIGDKYNIDKRYQNYDDVLNDPEVDFVHINTPIPNHAEQSIAALKAGKHVACTVPMATSVEACETIVNLCKETGLKFLKASHQQDMDGWPGYWPGLPPMHYATHCVGPVLGLTKGQAEYVSCFPSGTIREEMHDCYNSPFAVESTHIKFKDSDLSAYIYRSLFDVARQYRESFEVYGDKKAMEWPLIEGEPLVLHTAKKPEPEIPEKGECPDYAHLLPDEIAPFTTGGVYGGDDGEEHLSFTQGAGHGGSHPHLVHEFLSALAEDRDPFPNAVQSANWTCTGIIAHESALDGGELKKMPEFALS